MRKHILNHKVSCAKCGRSERIEIKLNGAIPSGWKYFGKINVNVCQTEKYFYKVPEGVDWKDVEKWKRVPNKCYNPKIRPKMVEYWEGPCCNKEGSK